MDHTCPDNAPLSPSITSRLPPLAIQPEETLELGYMPQRDDFERVCHKNVTTRNFLLNYANCV